LDPVGGHQITVHWESTPLVLDERARFLAVRDGPAVARCEQISGGEGDAMKDWLVLAAVLEAATGVTLLIVPSLVGQLLFGTGLTGTALPIARVTGIALIALGVACWPGPPRVGMVTYGAAVTLYLLYLGVAGNSTGVLLWPAVILHATLTALLTRTSTTARSSVV
jgi:hypothetical protein